MFIREALPRTRERAESIRSGSWRPAGPPTRAERRFTGVSEPLLDQGNGTHSVAAEVEAALDVAELELVDEYCRWLIRKEECRSAELREVRMELEHRNGELAGLRVHTEAAQRHSRDLELELDRVAHSFTWRLRTMIRRVVRS